MNRKIKLSSLSESLRKQVKLQMNEGSSKLSQMPKDLRGMILKEMAEMGEAPMMNSEDAYFNAGQQTAKAVHRKRGGVNQTQWFNRALALEQGENKRKAQAAFDSGYKSETSGGAPEYFREDAINETGPGDEHYIDSEFGPLLADEDQYGYHMQVRSTNAKTKFMSLNKNQLLCIIDAIKRG